MLVRILDTWPEWRPIASYVSRVIPPPRCIIRLVLQIVVLQTRIDPEEFAPQLRATTLRSEGMVDHLHRLVQLSLSWFPSVHSFACKRNWLKQETGVGEKRRRYNGPKRQTRARGGLQLAPKEVTTSMVGFPQLGDYDGGPDFDDETPMVGCEILQSFNQRTIPFCTALR